MAQAYDLVVVGTGVAASVVAGRVRKAGWTVAVVDSRPFGGTCVLRGCDPKKVLLAGAEAVDRARRLSQHGVAGDTRIDWPALMAFKRGFTDPVPQRRERGFAEQGIDALHGAARFTGPDRIAVGEQTLQARHILLATGARPVQLSFPGAEHLTTSDAFMELPDLPRRIVMVGGGYIAAEFSHLAARAGAQVTVVQRAGQMLTPFDPELVGWLMARFRDLGIDVRTGTTVARVERNQQGGFVVRTQGGQGEGTIEADLVVHAAGRAPDLAPLDLDAGGVARDEHGRLRLNAYLQSTSNPRVYAAGDAAGAGPPLTPVASLDGEAVAGNLLHGNRDVPDYNGVPSVAFTIPPIAAVGLSEQAARAQGLQFSVSCSRADDWFTAKRLGESVYGYKVLIEQGSDRILGAHLVGPHAEETINLFALAIRHRLPASVLRDTVYAYPTAGSDVSSML
ncbi:MAG TPA: NAD(P)/FAD-dependent oxidoreductase [Acetobacteraceae bacterium]|nr:NAD(P)/FAD-dependent oxidoreductase [Acetobacteraceae bacterium]